MPYLSTYLLNKGLNFEKYIKIMLFPYLFE